jgi:predicted small lipoprotein YifL
MRARLALPAGAAVALLADLVGACGQRGPLYLPDEAKTRESAPATQPAPGTTPAPNPTTAPADSKPGATTSEPRAPANTQPASTPPPTPPPTPGVTPPADDPPAEPRKKPEPDQQPL